jgi:ferredoxin
MCEFCQKYGEGQKWYLQARNFVGELFNDQRKQYIANLYENFETMLAHGFAAADRLDTSDPAIIQALAQAHERQKEEHFGQVIPLEDVEKILDTTVNVVRMPCVCRSVLHGVHDARFCFHFATFKSDLWPKDFFDQWPDWSRDLDVVTKEEAKKDFQKLGRQGVVHTVWHWGAPWIGSFCNCSPADCIGLSRGLELRQRLVFKSEYVAAIDIEKCNGCRDCMKICPFGAIKYAASSAKCTADQLQCFGCGACRSVCAHDAITLFDRNAIPALANEW